MFNSRFITRFLPVISFLFLFTWFLWFSFTPYAYEKIPTYLEINTGESLQSISRKLVDLELLRNQKAFIILVKTLGKSKQLMAGRYKIDQKLSPIDLIDKLTNGEFAVGKVMFPEGVTFLQMIAIMQKNIGIKNTISDLPIDRIMDKLNIDNPNPEGLFFPDTYNFSAGTTDLEILALAHNQQQRILNELWAKRIRDLPIKTPYEALVLASIVEKETGDISERAHISEVFINRLNKRIRLQADPTVIYGIGPTFDGNLRKKDLRTDTPYNTYTRYGLPPTPISMPGRGAIESVLNPTKTGNLYFVARGNGRHYFSKTLKEHNRAVNKYQRKK